MGVSLQTDWKTSVAVCVAVCLLPYLVPLCCAGAVKITPAHDFNDYECGVRHNLPFINIITDDGFICNTGTKFDV